MIFLERSVGADNCANAVHLTYREWAQNAADKTVEAGVDSDTERQRQRRGDREARRFEQPVYSVLDIPSNTIEKQGSIGGRHAFLKNCGISEAKKGVPPGFFRTHARRNVVFDPHGDVRFQLKVNLLPYLRASEEI